MQNRYLLILSLIIIVLMIRCQKDEIITDPGAKLEFSTDTVSFDTVFTTIGSTTRQFQVYNPHNQRIKISRIFLAKGSSSNFRININGIPGHNENIEIAPKDSIFIFVEVNVDPDRDEMVEKDSIIFETNGNVQDVKLIAFGQDVHLINGEIIETATWTNEKPYLVYNSMLVDTNHILTIEAGTQIFFHKNSTLFVQGTLLVNGTVDEPVTFSADRLEDIFDDVPDQWSGIHFVIGSRNNVINYAEIKNANIGIRIDSVVEFSQPTLTISNSIIENMMYAGIYGLQSTILAYNCVIADCGQHAVAFPIGGAYEFYHCTIYNNFNWATRTTPSIWFQNYFIYESNVYIRPLEHALFANCIIYGGQINEIGYDDTFAYAGDLNFTFDHCIIKTTDTLNINDTSRYKNILLNKNPRLAAPADNNFELDTLSPAKDFGALEYANFFPLDIKENSRRSDEGPDLGAYERME